MSECKHYFSNWTGNGKIDDVKCDNCGMTYYQFLLREIGIWQQESRVLQEKLTAAEHDRDEYMAYGAEADKAEQERDEAQAEVKAIQQGLLSIMQIVADKEDEATDEESEIMCIAMNLLNHAAFAIVQAPKEKP